MRYLHKLRTRTLLIILALVIAIGTASVIPGVSTAARVYSNRLISAIAPTSPAAVNAAPMTVAQDKNVQPGKPEPQDEFSVIQYNGQKPPNQNNAIRVATVTTTANEVEPNNTFGTANAIGTDVKVVGNVFPNADEDWYSFTAATGDKVHAAVMTLFSANASTDSQLRLFQSDGTTLIEFDDDDGVLGGLSSTIAGATIPSAGTYYLQVKHFSATNQLRPYELWVKVQSGAPTPEVEGNDTPATANPLPTSGYVSGARNPATATEQDWYSFTANAGDTIFLSLDLDPERDNVQWNGRLGLALFGDAANQILVVDDASTGSVANPLSEAMFMTVKDAGTYFAFVDSASGATGGPTATYGLSVSVLPRTNVGVNCTTYTSTNVPQTIGPGAGLVSSTITIPGNPRIAQIRVTLDITHALMADLDIHLRSPAGNDNGLLTDIGATVTGGQTQMVLTLDDNAGIPPVFTVLKGLVVKPELAYRLGWFNGEDAGGTWTLDIRDDGANASGGTLNGWSIEICEMPPAPSCGAGFAQTTVFTTDFESGDAGFTHSGVTDEWERGLPTFAPVTGCNSGTNCWKTDLDNTYNPGVAAGTPQDLLSPPINLAGLSGPITLTWAMKYQIENATFDRAFVDVQEVGGANPKRVWEWLDATMTDTIGNPSVTIQESSGWAIYRADISSFAGQNIEIRFNLTTDNTVQLAGLAIDDVSVTACRALSADLQITKTDGVATATPGGSVTYTIVASNNGPDAVTGATVADTFPAAIVGATWTCVGAGGGTCTAVGSGNISDTVNLPSGGSVTYTVMAPISAAATGTLSNTATVSSSITDPTPANNSATDSDTLTPMANLAITKTDGVTSAVPGQSVTYTITASNAGPSNAPGSTVADTFPASLTATWTCVGAGGGTCTAAGSGNINDTVNLPVGGSVTYTVNAAISASATGTLSNTATVATAGGVTDPTPGNNSATDSDTLTPMANLGITKTNGVTSVTAGNTTTYTIVASNTGPSNAPGSTVADTFPAAITGVTWTCVGAGGGTCTANGSGNINEAVNLPVGGSVTFTAVATISAGASGTLVNTATVATGGGVTDPTPGNNSATDTDTITIPCTITCPTDQVAWTSTTSTAVNYPAPTTGGGGCGTVTCSPASGSTFNVGTTTVTCSTTAGPSCSFNVTVNQLTLGAALADPIACTGPGNKVNGSFSATNNSGASATVSVSATLSNIAYLPNTATATQSGSIIVLANVISWTGTLGAGQTVTVNWMGQIADLAQPSSQACSVVTATANGLPVAGQTQACLTVNCPAVGPGGILPATSEASDQKAGSVLIYNVYTSSTDPTKQNTRINITNVHLTRSAFVHLFFVAEGCAIADSYICLTGNQTASFLASDLDPGTTGYLVAIAVDGIRGCPISFNYLIGDEYVKFNSGHAANLGAIAFSQIAGGLPACDGNSVTAQLNFDGTSYNRTPATLALSNVGSRADGNDTLLILNRIGGNLGIGASSLGTLFGILYDDAENALSFNVTGGCQLRSSLSNNFPRTTPRFETFIPAGRTGWLKVFNQTGAIGMTGAAINNNANAASSAGAFNQGHNLHHLTLNSGMNYVIPVFPPSC